MKQNCTFKNNTLQLILYRFRDKQNQIKSSLLSLTLLLLLNYNGVAQFNIGTNTTNLDAVLQLTSSDSSQGLITPIVTTTNRPTCNSTNEAMLIYNITDSVMQYCDGNNWITVSSDSFADGNGIISALPANDVSIDAADNDLRITDIDTLDLQGVNHIKGVNRLTLGNDGHLQSDKDGATVMSLANWDPVFLMIDGSDPNWWSGSVWDYRAIWRTGTPGNYTYHNPIGNNTNKYFIHYERYRFHDSTAFRTGLYSVVNVWNEGGAYPKGARQTWRGRNNAEIFAINGSSQKAEIPYLSSSADYYSTAVPTNPLYLNSQKEIVAAPADSFSVVNPITNSGTVSLRTALRSLNDLNPDSDWTLNADTLYSGPDSTLVIKGGNVGIGTTSPSAKFHIHNDVSGADSAFVVTGAGNVGIGTTNPQTALDIKDNEGVILRLSAIDIGSGPPMVSNISLNGYQGRGKGVLITDQSNTDEWFIGEGYNYNGIGIGYDVISNSQSEYAANTFFYVGSTGRIGIGTTAPSTKFHIQNDASGSDSAFVVTNAGNVGIGTTSPGTKLDVQGGDTYNLTVGGSSGRRVRIFNGTSHSQIISSHHLDLMVNEGTSAIFMNSNGNVGLSTTGPTARLDVRTGGSGDILNLYDSSTEVFTVIDGGNVGIGTTSPNAYLHVAGNSFRAIFENNGTTAKGRLTRGTGTFGLSTNIHEYTPFAQDDVTKPSYSFQQSEVLDHIKWERYPAGSTTANTLMYIKGSTGNVGINTTNPSAKFHIHNDVLGNDSAFVVTNAGNVGVGTIVPSDLLQVNGGIYLTSNSARMRLMRESGPNYIDFEDSDKLRIRSINTDDTNGNTRLTIQSDGNIGIGDDDPSEKLEVAGNISPGTDNTYDLGTASLRWDDVYATNGTIQTSDKRLKTDIAKLTYGLNEISKMNPVHFQWKNDTSRKKIGFIAQEMMQIIPEVVNIGDDSLKTLGINYAELVVILTKAIQEQQKMIDDQKNQLLSIQNKNHLLKSDVEKITTINNHLQNEISRIWEVLEMESQSSKVEIKEK